MGEITHVDLFSGIGGFALAAKWTGIKTILFCEIDKSCRKDLNRSFPDVPIIMDIKELTYEQFIKATGVSTVDIVSGGFPCQPFSIGGQQQGTTDDRYLWPEMLRVIKELRPTWVIGENVAGIVEMALEEVCAGLEAEGYEVQPLVIPACAVNAPHRRDRVWILANTHRKGVEGQRKISKRIETENKPSEISGWETKSPFCPVDDGVPGRVAMLKALGNAIVPQVAYEIMRGIKKIEEAYSE